MKITLNKRVGLFAFLLPYVLILSTTIHAKASKLAIESGGSAQSRQCVAMEEEQWNDTCNLRRKVNRCTEKKWDKADAVFDNRGKCEQSVSINAYWELNTLRRLDCRTGRIIIP